MERARQSKLQKSCCTVGKFEAFHRGHRFLIEKAKEICSSVKVISIRKKGERLFSDKERAIIAESLGVNLIPVNFDSIKELSPQEFFVLLKRLGCKVLIVGKDWRFGRERSGDVELAKELGKIYGIEVLALDTVKEEGKKVSTSRIISLLKKGQIEEANKLLGFPYFTVGKVERGRRIGRKIGYPTVNVSPEKELPLPNGVYAVNLIIDGERLFGIANYGVRPTFGGVSKTLEVFIPDGELPPLYGKEVTVEFLSFLRPEKHFPSVEELKNQIKLDLEKLKTLGGKDFGGAETL